MTRVVMIEITGPDEHQVTCIANLLADEAKMSIVFMSNAYEHFAEREPRSAGDPAQKFPDVDITNTVLARTT